MNVKTLGLLAGLALCGSAFAQSEQDPNQQQMGEQQKGEQQKGQKELTGTVIGIKKDDVMVRLNDDPGAIVSLKVDHNTQLDGKMLKKGQSIESSLKKDFSPGSEVRASFDLQKMENKAVSIEHKK